MPTLAELNTKRDELKEKHTRLTLLQEQAQKSLIETQARMKELGTTPETIDEDLRKAEELEKQQITAYETSLKQFEAEITTAEAQLNADQNQP